MDTEKQIQHHTAILELLNRKKDLQKNWLFYMEIATDPEAALLPSVKKKFQRNSTETALLIEVLDFRYNEMMENPTAEETETMTAAKWVNGYGKNGRSHDLIVLEKVNRILAAKKNNHESS